MLFIEGDLFNGARVQVPARKTKQGKKKNREQKATSQHPLSETGTISTQYYSQYYFVLPCTHTYTPGLLLLRPHAWPIKKQTYNGTLPRVSLQTGGNLFSSFHFFSFPFPLDTRGGIWGKGIRRRIPRESAWKRTDGLSPTTAERIHHVRERTRLRVGLLATMKLLGLILNGKCLTWHCLEMALPSELQCVCRMM